MKKKCVNILSLPNLELGKVIQSFVKTLHSDIGAYATNVTNWNIGPFTEK